MACSIETDFFRQRIDGIANGTIPLRPAEDGLKEVLTEEYVRRLREKGTDSGLPVKAGYWGVPSDVMCLGVSRAQRGWFATVSLDGVGNELVLQAATVEDLARKLLGLK